MSKKNMRWVMALFVSWAMMTNLTMPIFANDNNLNVAPAGSTAGATTYTADQAADMAIQENFELRTSEIDRAKLGRQIDDTLNNVNNVINTAGLTITDIKGNTDPLIDNLTQLRNNVTATDENNIMTRAILRTSIKGLFVSIYKAEIQLKAQNEQLSMDEKLIQINRLQVSLGRMSRYDFESSYNDHLKNVRSRDALVMNIGNMYGNLKSFMGVDVKREIKLDMGFVQNAQVIMPDYQAGLVRMNSNNLKRLTQGNDLQRLKDLKTSVKEKYPPGSTASGDVDTNLDKSKSTYDNTIKSMPYTYESAYSDVKDAYLSYVQKQRELVVKNMDLKNGEIKVKYRRLSQLEFQKLQTQTKQLEYELELSKIAFVSSVLTLDSVISGTNRE